MATFGKIGEYYADTEEWTQYVECLKFFLIANKVTEEEMKRATLLSVISLRTFKSLRNLLTPEKPGDKPYADLVKVLTDHFSPKPSKIVQRAKFYRRSRKPGESIATFVAELRASAEHCNFGRSLDDMIRDRVVCGVNDDAIQKRLLAEGDKLTLTKALTLAQSYENTVKDATTLVPNDASSQQIHRVQSTTQPQRAQSKKPCYRCTRTGHSTSACKFRKECCHNCKKIGHIKKALQQGNKAGEWPQGMYNMLIRQSHPPGILCLH